MKLIVQTPQKALKAFIKQRPLRSEIDKFKVNLIAILDKINTIENLPNDETEEHLKNNVRDFLLDTYYKETNEINTKDKKDLVIYLGTKTDSPVGVIIEAKRPSNEKEMVTPTKANSKALWELILYYFDERIKANNAELKQLIITNINQWYIIDANYFDKHIYRNNQIKKLYELKQTDKKDNTWFYEEINKTLAALNLEIPCVGFDIRNYSKVLRNADKDDDRELIALYKILSPQHLLKQVTPNDSNSLSPAFYKELLHIIGLEEAKEGGKNIIRRKLTERNEASLIEATIEALNTEDIWHRIPDLSLYGANKEERTFNIALELCITWINRILFLKLLEGQLINYHRSPLERGRGVSEYRFLNTETIHDYDELFKLFHRVLAVNIADRSDSLKVKYSKVPYLNSSLFEISELEDQTIKVNSLDNSALLELLPTTVLKTTKKQTPKLPTLQYLQEFLDAYNFASEGEEDIQEDNKTIITASVLGKVFEKINGYKDGSVFTPSFITMYMCRKSIRLAVVQKFKDYFAANNPNITAIDSIQDIRDIITNKVITRQEANKIINSLKICDPAVGSGHFLVSALNEIIVIKSELNILLDEEGKTLRDYEIEIINDELIITDENGKLFTYNPENKESNRVQKTLFQEKQTIIENCLFGVDINPNSVKICRLRLWIELLKNAYYKPSIPVDLSQRQLMELETLPNIDINIKCGNSLISRFALDADLSKALKKSKWTIDTYKLAVQSYHGATNKADKQELLRLINEIKNNFRTEIFSYDPKIVKLQKLQYEYNMLVAPKIFMEDEVPYGNKGTKKAMAERLKKYEEDISILQNQINEIKNNVIYKNAFEWRFEFPEVLDEKGVFVGFDLVIGNPPYVVVQSGIYLERYKTGKCYDLYCYFYELGKSLLKENFPLAFITPSLFIKGLKFKTLQDFLLKETSELIIKDNGDNVFEGVAMPTAITFFRNKPNSIEVNWEDLFVTNPISKKIKSNSKLLGDISKIQRGLEIGKDKTLKSKTKFQLITGEDIEKYYVKNIRFIDQNTYDEFIKGDLDYFKKERVLIRETGSSITCVYLDKLLLSTRSLYSIIPNKGISPKYIQAILCSKLIQFFYQSEFKADTDVFPKIRIAQVKKIPLKTALEKEQNPFIGLVDQIIAAKQQNQDTKALEAQIDQMVYKLYELTDEEIKIVEGE